MKNYNNLVMVIKFITPLITADFGIRPCVPFEFVARLSGHREECEAKPDSSEWC